MKTSLFFFVLLQLIATTCIAQSDKSKVVCTKFEDYILTHQLTPFGPVPTAFDPNGVYPYVSYAETSNRPVLKKYRFVVLENSQMKVTICPDLGGKVTSMIHKASGKEVLYVPDVIRYTRILPRFYFVAGGIEVSFPISHTPVQNESVLYKIDKTPDRIYVTCGERELRFGMQWSVEYSLGTSDAFLTQRAVFYNPNTSAYPWMSWSNAALPSAPDTKYDFPNGRVLSHSSKIDTLDWQKGGPKTEADIKEMTGYFWKTKDANAFGAFTPSLGTGLYHIADVKSAPGIKLWSYGVGDDSAWSVLSTAKHQTYIEIQGGPISDQSIKLEMQPKETKWHVEYWIPTDKELSIYSLKVPDITLRPVKQVPLFTWARNEAVKCWEQLVTAYLQKGKVPAPPQVHQNLWAPSGMENLDKAFNWAIQNSKGEEADLWKFHFGSWLAGRGKSDEAIATLSKTNNGVSKVLLARLLKMKGDMTGARNALESIKEPWLQLHPQVVVERDKVLRNLGPQTIAERETWLSKVAALNDEWVIERRVQLLIDKGEIEAARKLLLSVPFQKVHQTYTRTNLWMQICEKLKVSCFPIPQTLGEDRLATFGAYREFE
ncbi:DUF5107 domain-containing protein [Chitinophagaceae bacterium LB-8]|uniref:DUF5107 domain-containing protein n=1 Tax=Paraflavisolibacter caeni TaxID=2982496 RepID=A0A9X3BFH2_9BACT|nr:DUF5107 domain-containing protein [Paraflavisolibacter caeni]MCU7548844.1 DUF5107 domain-containing protein [Paraflavisolibacter caeni]